MSGLVQLSAADARRIPWKNGRGFTDELALWPPNASFERGDFDWRISVATVDASGPFSSFPGFDRIFVVTHGEAAEKVRVVRAAVHSFSGDVLTSAELIRGIVHDFNVLYRRDSVRAEVDVLGAGHQVSAPAERERTHAFVHVVTGRMLVRAGQARVMLDLRTGDSLWMSAGEAQASFELGERAGDTLALLTTICD